MRTIKFRGIDLKTGEWVYGNYIEKIDPTKQEPTFWASLIHDKALTAIEVNPDTVGQFTGESDKNGKEIYKGDRVKTNAKLYIDKVLTITFQDGAFCLYSPVSLKGDTAVTIRDAKFQARKLGLELELEVIGNIHDNPEMI